MRVLFAGTGDETQASTRLRISSLTAPLNAGGIESDLLLRGRFYDLPVPDTVARALFFLTLLLRARSYDAVYIHRVTPRPAGALALGRVAPVLVFDFDDAIYTDAEWITDRNDERKRRRTNAMLGAADAVVAGSPSLATYARENGVGAETALRVLPTPLDRTRYAAARATSEQDDTVRLGWIGYPDNLRYLATTEDALRETLDAHEEVELVVITAGELPVEPLADRPDVTYRTWSAEAELELLATADIGIRPLADTEWTRNKGGYTSIVQCMALGMPVVVTPVGYLTDLVEHGQTGYHAETDEDWEAHLHELIVDTETRARMGAEALASLERKELWLDQYVEDVADLLVSLTD